MLAHPASIYTLTNDSFVGGFSKMPNTEVFVPVCKHCNDILNQGPEYFVVPTSCGCYPLCDKCYMQHLPPHIPGEISVSQASVVVGQISTDNNYFFCGTTLVAVRIDFLRLLCVPISSVADLTMSGHKPDIVVCDTCFDTWAFPSPAYDLRPPPLKMPPRCYHLPVMDMGKVEQAESLFGGPEA